MPARRASNAAILDRTLRRLRRDGRLDKLGEALATAAATSAGLVDAACAADSDVAAYARARVLSVYVGVLVQLAGRVGPLRDEDDPWEVIARELVPNTVPEAVDDENAPDWDEVKDVLAQDPSTWLA